MDSTYEVIMYLTKVSGGYFPTNPTGSARIYSTTETDLSKMGLQYDT